MKKLFTFVISGCLLFVGIFLLLQFAKADTTVADLNGLYQFDGSSVDTGGSGYDGTDTNITYSTGTFSNAAAFTIASSSKISVGDHYDPATASPSSTLAFSFWFKTSVNDDTYQTLFSKMDADNVGYYVYLGANNDHDGALTFVLKKGGWPNGNIYRIGASSTLKDGNWHHIAFNFKEIPTNSDAVRTSFDGVIATTTCEQTCGLAGGNISDDATFYFGWWQEGVDAMPGHWKFTGSLDNFAILTDRYFTDAEMTSAWASGAGDRIIKTATLGISGKQQYKFDATSTIAAGGSTTESSTVVFGATVTAAGTSTVKLEVEVRPAGISFTGTPTASSSLVASGSYTTTTFSGENVSYHWQARAKDSNGATSTWQLFGPSTTSTDFVIALPKSAYFDNSSSSVKTAWRFPASQFAFSSANPFTVEFWYRSSSSATSAMQILDTRTDDHNGFAVYKDSSGINFSLNCNDTSSTIHLSSAERQANRGDSEWHHVAVTKATTTASTDAFKLYFEGTQQTGSQCYASTSTYSLWVGGNPSSSVRLFDGFIDELRIWNTERSSSSISASSTQEVSTSTNLKGYWRFNGTSTDIATGNATSGQSGIPKFEDESPFGHFLLGESAVSSSQIRWASSTIYATEWSNAVATWNGSPQRAITVTSTAATSTAELLLYDINDSLAPFAAYYFNLPGLDEMHINAFFLDPENSTGRQNALTHELGHALGLAHSFFGNVMYFSINDQTTLGDQDLNDYHYLWGY